MELDTNLKNNEMCIATWVYGRKYQTWIPIYVYSIKRNYPNYDVKIFIDTTLSIEVRRLLTLFNLQKFVSIIEKPFPNLNGVLKNDIEKRCYRWLISDSPYFEGYRYVYIGDVDIFLVDELSPLHEQHILDMKHGNGYYSNANRLRMKDYLLNTANCRLPLTYTFRLTGLHFVNREVYFSRVKRWQERIMKYLSGRRNVIIDYFFFRDDERCLWLLNCLSRIKPPKGSYELNDGAFRPLHGVHFAVGREYDIYKKALENNEIKNNEHYGYFLEFCKEYNADPMLRRIVWNSSFYVIEIIRKTCAMWGRQINQNEIETQ